jgi:hypothetical protein
MKIHPANGRAPDFAAPFCPRRRDVGSHDRAIEHLHQMGGFAGFREQLEGPALRGLTSPRRKLPARLTSPRPSFSSAWSAPCCRTRIDSKKW